MKVLVMMPGQLSVAITKAVFGAGTPATPQTVIGAGQVITGGWLSVIVTVKEQLLLPQAFVAVTVTLVTPTLKVLPLPSPAPLPVVAPVKEYVTVGAGEPPAVVV
jgi:hypothetical protein